jgi:hypothetical protein
MKHTLFGALLVLALAGAGCAPATPPGVPSSGTSTPAASAPVSVTGTLEGTLKYPAEAMPPNLRVCAEDSATKHDICTTGALHGSYTLSVPVGSYYVYAIFDSTPGFGSMAGYKAYYSEFVTCGLQASCPSHAPILVHVTAGADIQHIDPNDWYK